MRYLISGILLRHLSETIELLGQQPNKLFWTKIIHIPGDIQLGADLSQSPGCTALLSTGAFFQLLLFRVIVKRASSGLKDRVKHILLTCQLLPDFRKNRGTSAKQMICGVA